MAITRYYIQLTSIQPKTNCTTLNITTHFIHMCFVAFNFAHFEVNCSCSVHVCKNQSNWLKRSSCALIFLTCNMPLQSMTHQTILNSFYVSHFLFWSCFVLQPTKYAVFWQVSPPLWNRQKPAVLTTLEPKYSSTWSPTSSELRQNSSSTSSHKIPSFKKHILTTVWWSMTTSLNHQLTLSSSAGQRMAIATCK